jgi:hypothetical protein
MKKLSYRIAWGVFSAVVFTSLNSASQSPLRSETQKICSEYPGTSAGAKIAACILDLPGTGGIADARGLTGMPAINSDPFAGVSKPVWLLVGNGTTLVQNTDISIPSNVSVVFSGETSWSIEANSTLSIDGTMEAGPTPIFGGKGSVRITSTKVPTVFPQWFRDNDFGTKVTKAIEALPMTGGSIDARGITGAQSMDTEVVLNKANVHLMMGNIALSYTKRFWVTADNVKIHGAGVGVTVIKASGRTAWEDSDPVIISSRYGPMYFGPTKRIENIEISGITFDGNYANLANRPFAHDTWGNGINIARCYQCKIHDNEVRNVAWQAIGYIGDISGDSNSNQIYNNFIHNFGEFGIAAGGISPRDIIRDNILTNGLKVPENPDGAIGIWATSLQADGPAGSNNDDIQISGNIITSMPSVGIKVEDGARRVIIAHNTIRGARQCIGVGYVVDDGRVARDISIIGNTCADQHHSGEGGILVGGAVMNPFQGVSISDNTVINAAGACFHVTYVVHARINNNTCRGAGGGKGARTEGLFLANAVSSGITSNQLTGASGAGISISDSNTTDTLIVANHLQGNNVAFLDRGTRTIIALNKESSGDARYTATGSASAILTHGQISSTLPVGTPPLVVSSTTPVANLTTVPTTYDEKGTQRTNTKIVTSQTRLVGGKATVSLEGPAAFSSLEYFCTASDTTGDHGIGVTKVNGHELTLSGRGSDLVMWICVGQ